ncbi:MAG: pantetheine-phosphate adenylyltransferase [Acidobacteria bacterium]|nr:pantetheine-phosphate adenylyltransferase [Acidobacteriota bacterium]MBI3657601.1 pantetheine-phosphate adenylyltransferase [Acidobacteriota bacterium]
MTVVYPGSFDPVTNGHLDIIERSLSIFDRVIVALLINVDKQPLFPVEERVDMLKTVTAQWPRVDVETFDGLLVNYALQRGAKAIVRGIRALSDFEYEFQMALMNRRMQPQIETVFMMPAEKYSYVSSRLVREIYKLGGATPGLIPDVVEQRMKQIKY